jgi:hypothetical protein
MSILSNAKPASEVRKLKALFFGPSKSGKTTLASTAPKAIFLDTEGGTMSIRDTDVDVLRISNWAEFETATKELMMGGHGYESVVLDSVTMLQEIAGEDAGLLQMIESPKGEPRQAYGKMGAKIRYKILQLNNLPMNVIFTAQLREREQEDIAAGQYPLTPDVTPAILRVLMAAPDIIARTSLARVGATVKDVEYRVIFGPETRSQVGNRKFELPYEATGLTIPKLIAMTKGAK